MLMFGLFGPLCKASSSGIYGYNIRVPYAHHISISKTRLKGERDINMKLNVRFLGQIA